MPWHEDGCISFRWPRSWSASKSSLHADPCATALDTTAMSELLGRRSIIMLDVSPESSVHGASPSISAVRSSVPVRRRQRCPRPACVATGAVRAALPLWLTTEARERTLCHRSMASRSLRVMVPELIAHAASAERKLTAPGASRLEPPR